MGVMQRYFPAEFLTESPSIILFSKQRMLIDWTSLALGRHCRLAVEERNDIDVLHTRLTSEKSSVVLMEWCPKGDTLAHIVRLREKCADVGILLLCSPENCAGRVAAYSAGADICLPLPIAAEELLVVVMTLAQRLKRIEAVLPTFSSGLSLCLKSGELRYGEKTLCLHRPELDFMQALAEAPRHFLSNEALLERLRYPNDIYGKRRLEVMLSRFRQRLKPLLAENNAISAGRGKGYGLTIPINIL